ncbi:MAG: DNA phosphorothioation-associated putative methyltransferase [Gomphosphaeria aponina SAG 52.96 = DSM 107014]|uniref:DNA phosphorothioation-associated putative methyltransferase n=1 Tax=Gomphosphaeria aponina SAG 52.96 = DSM 107014 TaxID=1521640 RepID=A0A941JP81_9CHRO|nr:DNA phosphorothioation-associated putative methyltransferase [Gomphosphaeria aponina SAG 52.96 = DSM 107014]
MLKSIDKFKAIAITCQNSKVGKILPDALYVHTWAMEAIDPLLKSYEREARETNEKITEATIIKFSLDKPKISYLCYPDFDTDPHPALLYSIVVDMKTLTASCWDYSNSENPPILHRKETFVTPEYPFYEEFAQLTHWENKLGLLGKSRYIGTRREWQEFLQEKGVAFEGHHLVCPLTDTSPKKITIDRHKAAIVRKTFSRPVRLSLEAGLFTPGTTFFDYGCGYGSDVQLISQQGYKSSGWDPFYQPNHPLTRADIVNLGYIINVIEDQKERRQALIGAWELTGKVLIVSAQVIITESSQGWLAYGDGVITTRNTFQKYYEQEELKNYIDQVLNVDAIPAALGVYFVFRDENLAQIFRASRFRSVAKTPQVRSKVRSFQDYEKMLTPLMNFVTERGRLPIKGELSNELALKKEFGNIRRAFDLVISATDEAEWEAIAEKRRQDLLIYLALSQFSKRPTVRQLSPQVREDIKALFGTYKQACLFADMMLFSLKDLENIADICHESTVGKKLSHVFLVHVSALESLDPLLRLYEGCASRTIGRLEDANIIKFYFQKPQISYLYYPDFDDISHPILRISMDIDLRDLQVRYRDYERDYDPPVLHEKDLLVTPDYPFYDKFAKLTRQEREWGLLDDFLAISHYRGWLKCLEDNCAAIKGHKLFWRKEAEPYKLKLLQAKIKARKQQY